MTQGLYKRSLTLWDLDVSPYIMFLFITQGKYTRTNATHISTLCKKR